MLLQNWLVVGQLLHLFHPLPVVKESQEFKELKEFKDLLDL